MSGPPDKIFGYDLSTYTTLNERTTQINALIAEFYSTYGVYPEWYLDSVVDAIYLGAYSS